jgi:exodeoxyribonuclease V beta subunit
VASDDEAAWEAACGAAAKAAVAEGPVAARRPLDALAASSPWAAARGAAARPCIAVRELPAAGREPRWRPHGDGPATLRARPLPAPRAPAWRASSYTGLARYAEDDRSRSGATPDAPVRDHDAAADAGEARARPASDGVEPVEADQVRWQARVPLADFPAGARPGHRVHAVLEALDFAAGDGVLDDAIDRALARREREDGWADALRGAVRAALDIDLDGAGLRLRGLRREDRLTELAFTLPVDAERGAPLTAHLLADALAATPGPGLPAGYPERLRALGFPPLRGFLSGFVDLAFRRGGRWYVVDWKTNRLGETFADYRRPALDAAMAHHHYVLQYHLYVVALHRYLRHRLADYDYDAHMGGVFYLFLRGLDPALGPASGVFADRPPRALVEVLDAALGGPRPAQ